MKLIEGIDLEAVVAAGKAAGKKELEARLERYVQELFITASKHRQEALRLREEADRADKWANDLDERISLIAEGKWNFIFTDAFNEVTCKADTDQHQASA